MQANKMDCKRYFKEKQQNTENNPNFAIFNLSTTAI